MLRDRTTSTCCRRNGSHEDCMAVDRDRDAGLTAIFAIRFRSRGNPACDFLLHDGRPCDAIEAAFLHDGPEIKCWVG